VFINNYISSVAISRLSADSGIRVCVCVCVWGDTRQSTIFQQNSPLFTVYVRTVTMQQRECEGINWIHLAQDEGQQQSLRHK
jgi:hypothetical protein